MSGPLPRIEAEAGTAPRLQAPVPEPVRRAARPAPGGVGLAAAGLAVLLVGLGVLRAADFVAAEFARDALLGWASLAVAGAGFGLLGAGAWRELAGLARLRGVDRWRADLAGGDALRRRRAARGWLRRLPEGETLRPAIDAVNDPDAILALLRAGPGARLRRESDQIGQRAAAQLLAATLAVPSPALVALVVAWRGLRLIRQVAALHGLRPGLLGTLRLLRGTMLSAGAVAATEFAVNAAAHAMLSNPLLGHVVGDVAASGLSARRMLLLARAAAVACSPLPPEDRD